MKLVDFFLIWVGKKKTFFALKGKTHLVAFIDLIKIFVSYYKGKTICLLV